MHSKLTGLTKYCSTDSRLLIIELGSAPVPEVVVPEGRPKVSPSSSGGSSVFEELLDGRRHTKGVIILLLLLLQLLLLKRVLLILLVGRHLVRHSLRGIRLELLVLLLLILYLLQIP